MRMERPLEPDFAALKSQVDDRLAMLVPDTGAPSCAARHSLLAPGKRLRALMTMLACEECGGEAAIALDVACAVEMIHTASLIFDDLPAMDDADLRRGVATSHRIFGEDVAILAGIGLLNGAFGVVARDDALCARKKSVIVCHLADAVGWHGLVQGQALDLSSTTNSVDVATIHDGKTGVLFVAATLGGAAAADASPDRMDSLRAYGLEIGRAYQALDDVLDIAVSSEVSGKTTDRDGNRRTALSGDPTTAMRAAITTAEAHLQAAKQAVAANGQDTPLSRLADMIRSHFGQALEMSV